MTFFLSFPACNGIFDGIYDDKPSDKDSNEYGFIEVDPANNSGTIYVDATDYAKWIYINFHTLTIDSVQIAEDMPDPETWDIALHRYDTKTNGAAVLETRFADLPALKASGAMPEGDYVEDIWTENKIIVDMSGMLDGNIKYAKSGYNAELSKWLFVDTSSMPPSYTPSDKVYIIKLKDNTIAAVRLRSFTNVSAIKGFMTIDYIYPLEF